MKRQPDPLSVHSAWHGPRVIPSVHHGPFVKSGEAFCDRGGLKHGPMRLVLNQMGQVAELQTASQCTKMEKFRITSAVFCSSSQAIMVTWSRNYLVEGCFYPDSCGVVDGGTR